MRNSLILAVLLCFASLPAHAARPDSWVTTKAKLALWTAPGIDSTDISVDTIDGNVTIYGKVDSNAIRQKAEQELKKVDGVRSVRNLLQVVPGSRAKAVDKDDKAIKEAVEHALKNNHALDDSSIDVKSVDKGVVLLGGKVADVGDELAAVRAAFSVAGVRRVVAEMKGSDQVLDLDKMEAKTEAKSKGGRTSDAWLTTEVKTKLFAEENVPATAINVDTRDGKVTLFGNVPTDEARSNAEKVARKTDGVTGVDNELTVVPSSEKKVVKAKDAEIEDKLKKAFRQREGLADVGIDVKGGVVRLTGTVPSRSRKLEAMTVSRTTPGVRSVSTDLKIKE